MGDITGVTKFNGVPTPCTVNMYRIDTGQYIGSTESDPITGIYNLTLVPSYVDVNVIALPIDDTLSPQISGPFSVDPSPASEMSSGYIFLTYSTSGSRYFEHMDKDATDHVDWGKNFGETLGYGDADNRIRYTTGNGGQSSLPYVTSVFDGFNKNWTLYLSASNATWSPDRCDGEYEFLDADGNTLAAIRLQYYSSYTHRVYYGPTLSSLTMASTGGSYPNTGGELTFTDTQILYRNTRASNYNGDWTLDNVDVNSIVSMRARLMSNSSYTGGAGGGAGGSMKVITPN